MMLKDLRGKDEKQLQGFLEKSESVLEMRQLCDSVHETADEKYTTSERKIKDEVVLPSNWLKSTLNAMDQFIAFGDVAFKAGGSEVLSLGWTAVKWVLDAVKADADRCAMWAEASERISRILLACKTMGKIFSQASRTEPTEMVKQILQDIPTVYEAILCYSWAARQQVERSAMRRAWDAANPYSKSAADASKTAYESIKAFYQRIREDGQSAFHEYATEAFKLMEAGQHDVINNIRATFDKSQEQMQEFANANREVLEVVKKLQPMTAYRRCIIPKVSRPLAEIDERPTSSDLTTTESALAH